MTLFRYEFRLLASVLTLFWGFDVSAAPILPESDRPLAYSRSEPNELGVDLALAVIRNDVTAAQQLIARGANVNCTDCARGRYAGRTPLTLAAALGGDGPENSMLRLLLRHKANPNLRASDGRSPLSFAVGSGINPHGGALDSAIELLLAGADPQLAGGANGYTPIFYWASLAFNARSQSVRTLRDDLYRDFFAIAKTFHQFGADLDHRDKDGWNALHVAASSCNPHGVLVMAALGIDPEAGTYSLLTAREIVARQVNEVGDSRECAQTIDVLNDTENIKRLRQIARITAPLVRR
jgi:hypothetical protein